MTVRIYHKEVTSHPLYPIWRSMRNRCYIKSDTNYRFYGAKGTRVAKRWCHNPDIFIEDCKFLGWKPGLQIDRKNTKGHYTPSNVRFVTSCVNNHNRKMQFSNRTGFVGVSLDRGSRYRARYTYKNKTYGCGAYATPEEAARARDIAILEAGLSHIIALQLETT